jgi:small-conductance mechanosensitive channel
MTHQLLYVLTVAAIGLTLFLWLRWWFVHLENRRAKRIENLKRFEAVKTVVPEDFKQGSSRKQALKGLETRFSVFRRTVLSIILIVSLLAILIPFLGEVPGTLVSLFVTAGAVIVGIAARPMVENFIAGFVLTLSKQLHTGDTLLIDRNYGTIEDITPTHTVIKLWDWRRYIVPNSTMLSKEILNYTTRESFIWAKIDFQIAHDADLNKAEELAVKIAGEHPLVVGDDKPQFWVMEMGRESVKCWLAMWAMSPPDAWSICTDTRKRLSEALHAHGIKSHTFRHSSFPESMDGEGSVATIN